MLLDGIERAVQSVNLQLGSLRRSPKGKSVRHHGVSQTMPFLVIPRSLLRGGFIFLTKRGTKKHENGDCTAGIYKAANLQPDGFLLKSDG